MAEIDSVDIIVLILLLVGSIAYFTKGTYWSKPKDPYANPSTAAKADTGGARDVLNKMEELGKNCVIFYGSQTGTAEDYASRLAKEGSARFGLKTMTADLEEYDYENLCDFPTDKIAIFVMATYGEGEPTDNAVDFWEFMTADPPSFNESADSTKPLRQLNYVCFGLGNNTYEHFNAMVRNLNNRLLSLGATRVGEVGQGDDGAGTMEEDFLAWKEPMWAAVAKKMSLEEREAVYEPVFAIEERDDLSAKDSKVYLGEPNKAHLEGTQKGPFNAHNPFIAPIKESHELFTVKDRNALHMEIDLTGSNLTYTTGDHIAIWPTNAGMEVDRFLKVFGLAEKREKVINVKGLDPSAKVPFPTPTTYDAAIRYHTEICAPVSRQFISTLAAFAPDEETKKEMSRLGSDVDYFKEKIHSQKMNIAQACESIHAGPWTKVPFSCLIEGLNKIQPRYYSISSSSMVQPKVVSISAVVESIRIPGAKHVLKGVSTNYLLALKEKQNGDAEPSPHGLTYQISGPRNKYDGIHVPCHIRHSNFKLPSDPSKPIIMVGPGTGVAPFRGFIQERAEQVKKGENVGETVLFFGCRKTTEDHLYKDEMEEYKKIMGDKLTIFNAFSREGAKKVYVQHLLAENAKHIHDLLAQKANFYVCGDAANMAREVNEQLILLIQKYREVPKDKAEYTVKSMRSSGVYQEDVWA